MIARETQLEHRPLADIGWVDRIAVFRALHLGDFLCAVPALRALKGRFPHAEITLIGLPWNRALVPRFPYIDRFLEFPGYFELEDVPWDDTTTRSFLQEAQDNRYDLAVQMHGDGRVSNAFVAQLRARISLGHRPADDGWPRLLSLERRGSVADHQIVRWLRLVGELGAYGNPALEFPVTASDREEVRGIARALGIDPGRPLIGINPGGKQASNRWPAERFAAVADRLAGELGVQVVITGIEPERAIALRIATMMQHTPIIAAGETSIGGLAALIERMLLLVTNDTGASHLAAALGTPSVILFGPTRPEEWAPLDGARHRALWSGEGNPIATIPLDLVVEESTKLVRRWRSQTS